MEAVLYICHGSRVKSACDEAVAFVERCKEVRQERILHHCFLELAEPTIFQGIQQCVEQGATKIRAIPVLLLTANHALIDIPKEINRAKQHYPQLEIQMGEPIGVHPLLIDLLVERLQQTNQEVTAGSKVVLVGRGSTNGRVKQDLSQIASNLGEKISHPVEVSFLTGCEPYFSNKIATLDSINVDKVFIIPYFLFTGILIEGIRKTVEKVVGNHDCQFIICDYLGNSPVVVEALNERIEELV
ncbi:sirohydrochlorin chelatase [Lysinibacillus endophyticus]|uniref:sirohydrochlorin chelatase n=1 Tax=Ureibacillus endophyticus TaxID=1978490 RepID=UPI00313563ED